MTFEEYIAAIRKIAVNDGIVAHESYWYPQVWRSLFEMVSRPQRRGTMNAIPRSMPCDAIVRLVGRVSRSVRPPRSPLPHTRWPEVFHASGQLIDHIGDLAGIEGQ